MDLKELREYKNEVVLTMNNYEKSGETILAVLVKNRIRIIDERIRYLEDKPIWDKI
jgi:hypothetical protein